MAASATLPLISVDDYLHTSYEQDVDYVDDHIEERSVGELDHSDLQTRIAILFGINADAWRVRINVELRVKVAPRRYRLPDVCVVSLTAPREQIIRTPPLLCVEILSPEDRLPTVLRRYQDFLDMGVPEVWILNPATRTAHVLHSDATVTQHRNEILRLNGTQVHLDLTTLFSILD